VYWNDSSLGIERFNMLIIRVQPPGSVPPISHEVPQGPFDIGRLPATEDVPRCVVTSDPSVSRNHARIVEDRYGQLLITNTSQRVPIGCEGGTISPGETRLLSIPTTFTTGKTTVTVERPPEKEGDTLSGLASLASSPFLQPRIGRFASSSNDLSVIAAWFEMLITVQRAPAGSEQFYAQTARALVEQIGMDIGLVLLQKQNGWTVTARYVDGGAGTEMGRGREFSITVLNRIAREKRTLYQQDDLPMTESLAQVHALVASPVLLPSGEVAGALYGVRCTPHRRRISISALEAQMVQVLSTAVGIGLARVKQEEETARMRVQLHQQFTDRLASELESDLGRLDPQDREITIMFADIRGFSRISERVGPAETFQFVSEVMEVMTDTVKRHDGAIMDYIGDELTALWNAPADQVEHSWQAVRCAAALAADLSQVRIAWQARLGEPVSIGVGLNTGSARVGNTGTRSKPKYGARGHTVNLASRVQGATKAFQCPILLTGSTRAQLPAHATVRRLGKVKVVGINDSVELFQLLTDSIAIPAEVLTAYDGALERFEAGDLTGTIELLKPVLLLPAGQVDGATRQLSARVESLISAGAKDYFPVIELISK
jgi:adenylate cyclase